LHGLRWLIRPGKAAFLEMVYEAEEVKTEGHPTTPHGPGARFFRSMAAFGIKLVPVLAGTELLLNELGAETIGVIDSTANRSADLSVQPAGMMPREGPKGLALAWFMVNGGTGRWASGNGMMNGAIYTSTEPSASGIGQFSRTLAETKVQTRTVGARNEFCWHPKWNWTELFPPRGISSLPPLESFSAESSAIGMPLTVVLAMS